MYRITALPKMYRVLLEFDGAFDYDPRALHRDLKRAANAVRRLDGTFDFLADFSTVRAIPPEFLKSGEQIVDWCRDNDLGRCANVLVTASQRLAISRRSDNDPRFDYFLTRKEAEDWLDAARTAPNMRHPLTS